MKIEKITIVHSNYVATSVFLHTDLPSQFVPEVSTQNLSLSFRAPKSSIMDYCLEHFPNVPIEVIHDD